MERAAVVGEGSDLVTAVGSRGMQQAGQLTRVDRRPDWAADSQSGTVLEARGIAGVSRGPDGASDSRSTWLRCIADATTVFVPTRGLRTAARRLVNASATDVTRNSLAQCRLL